MLPASEPVPAAEGRNLTVSDRYVLFARRRSANSVLCDIERFKGKLASDEVDPHRARRRYAHTCNGSRGRHRRRLPATQRYDRRK